jgi:hypothetical protein
MKVLFILSLIYFSALSQEFQITFNNNLNIQPVSDPFTGDIYYREDWTGNIMRIRPDGSDSSSTIFTSIPVFSKLRHIAYYFEFVSTPTPISKLIQHDFSTGDTTILTTEVNMVILSPDENKLLYSNPNHAPQYYSLIDSAVYDPGIRLNCDKVQWINDSTLIYIDNLRQRILKYSYIDNSIDTLVRRPAVEDIVDLSCNPEKPLFAYSYFFNNGDDIGVNLFDLSNQIDTIVFNFNEDDPQLAGSIVLLDGLNWSPCSDRLLFVGNIILPNVGEIYVYNNTSKITYRYTRFGYNDIGTKGDLSWYNSDTVLYTCRKPSALDQIFGFEIQTPVILQTRSKPKAPNFIFNNFPNPFNSNTTITFKLPQSDNVKLYIYNCLGEKVRIYDLEFLSFGEHQITWDGKDKLNVPVVSGIYFIELISNNYRSVRRMLLLR